MQKNPIPGNVLGEMDITDATTRDQIVARRNLLIGGQDTHKLDEPRFVAEAHRLRDALKKFPGESSSAPQTIAYAQLGPYVDKAVEALEHFTGYEDNLRGQATEILLGMVPKPVEVAFTALMERAERWNEED